MHAVRIAIVVSILALPVDAARAQTVEEAARTNRDVAFVARTVAVGMVSPFRWTSSEWLQLGGGLSGLAILSLIDDEARTLVRRQEGAVSDAVARRMKPFGALGSAAVIGAFLGIGVVADQPAARAIAVDAITASILASALLAPAVQELVGRSRPWHGRGTHSFQALSGRHSFPSGHATQAFVVASVVAAHAESSLADALAYSVAGLVAWSRMHHDAHHLSDVTAGALLGTVVGRWVVRQGRGASSQPSITPAPGSPGVTVRFSF